MHGARWLLTPHPASIDALGSLLEDTSPTVRLQAALGLSESGDARAIPELQIASGHPPHRLQATRGLAHIDTPEATALLQGLLRRKLAGNAVRAAAAAGLAARAPADREGGGADENVAPVAVRKRAHPGGAGSSRPKNSRP